MKRRRYRKKAPPLNIHLFLCALYIAGAVFMDFHFIVLLIGLVIPYLGVDNPIPVCESRSALQKGKPEWAIINVKIKSPFLNPYMTTPIIIITILAIFFMGYDYIFARLIVHYGVFEVRDAPAIFRSENIINTCFNRDHINAYSYFIVGLIHAITLYLMPSMQQPLCTDISNKPCSLPLLGKPRKAKKLWSLSECSLGVSLRNLSGSCSKANGLKPK